MMKRLWAQYRDEVAVAVILLGYLVVGTLENWK